MAIYTPNEVRTIIKNCNTLADLATVEFQITVTEAFNYTENMIKIFEWIIQKQRMEIQKLTN